MNASFNEYVSDDTSCNPLTPTTFLFSYTNDLAAQVINNVWHVLAQSTESPHYNYVATVRFDVENEDAFFINDDWSGASSTIMNHQPDPSLEPHYFFRRLEQELEENAHKKKHLDLDTFGFEREYNDEDEENNADVEVDHEHEENDE
ncbi:hypothetical protein GCK72_001568 [Caenorhabditis remanei]|uniref:Uncharacterized protein n=1 Tax=Caenorhabditis remanei TaxID=31234 RepID=A0A6A5HR71_CAERE|nr:hypothetical protein GCK72_001568 [Caenorhabditis remanei]KAF1769751.1 hypothetical protein GCK72_001568 [Caenorhabditis remanei]